MKKYYKMEKIKYMIKESISAQEAFIMQSDNIGKAVIAIKDSIKAGKKILICGNGGSAADAQHIAAELVGRFRKERKALPAIALTTDTSILTAWSNDYSFGTVFQRQVESLAQKGDILIGLSTSGNSTNVIKAFEEGNKIGTVNISFTGKDGGKLKPLSKINISSPSNNTARIQESHMVAYHIICELIEEEI